MQSDCHIARAALEAIVISFYVCVQESFMIDAPLLHSLDHRLGAEVREQRVVELDVAAACRVELCDLLAVRKCDVIKVLLCIGLVC